MTSELPSARTQSASRSPSIVGGELPPGTILDEQFEIQSLIGRGGMAVVYQAKDLRMDRLVAIKMLTSRLQGDDGALKRFQREAVAVATLSHPNIVSVFGLGKFNDQPYVIMELLEGTTLADLIRDNANLGVEYKIGLFLQILDALSYAHSKGVIHRDLKPRNIMLVNSNATVKLVDFGIAKILSQAGKQVQTLTQTGELFGTVSYMSPEQCRGEPLDARADIYSMGCLMYEVLSGRVPFEGASAYALMAKHLDQQLSQPPCDDPVLSAIVFSALAKDPQHRPQSAEELADALRKPREWQPKRTTRPAVVPTKLLLAALTFCALLAAGMLFAANVSSLPVPYVSRQQSGRVDPYSIVRDINSLWDKANDERTTPRDSVEFYREGKQLLERNERAFADDPELRKFYFWRLAVLSYNCGDLESSERCARHLIALMEQEKRARGQIGFDHHYADGMFYLVETLLSKRVGNLDEALDCAHRLGEYLLSTASSKQDYDYHNRFLMLADRFLAAGRKKAFDDCKSIATQLKENADHQTSLPTNELMDWADKGGRFEPHFAGKRRAE
ncbi:MAG TPA: protein kinase [Candidatus Obscuribacterales bacterium]